MIIVEVDDKKYMIKNANSVSDGPLKEFIEDCIYIVMQQYKGPSDGFIEPYLYIHLGEFKSIKLISCDFKPPKDAEQTIY